MSDGDTLLGKPIRYVESEEILPAGKCRMTIGGQEIIGTGSFKRSNVSDNPVIAAVQTGYDVSFKDMPVHDYPGLGAMSVGDIVNVNIYTMDGSGVEATMKAKITDKSEGKISFDLISKETA